MRLTASAGDSSKQWSAEEAVLERMSSTFGAGQVPCPFEPLRVRMSGTPLSSAPVNAGCCDVPVADRQRSGFVMMRSVLTRLEAASPKAPLGTTSAFDSVSSFGAAGGLDAAGLFEASMPAHEAEPEFLSPRTSGAGREVNELAARAAVAVAAASGRWRHRVPTRDARPAPPIARR